MVAVNEMPNACAPAPNEEEDRAAEKGIVFLVTLAAGLIFLSLIINKVKDESEIGN